MISTPEKNEIVTLHTLVESYIQDVSIPAKANCRKNVKEWIVSGAANLK